MSKKTCKIVAYHTDLVDSDACYYDTPGPVLFYYRPKGKKFSAFPVPSEGEWVEVHPKYRDSKKIGKEQGFCMGGDYGIMKMSRYTMPMTLPGVQATNKETRDLLWCTVYDKVCSRAKDIALTLVKDLNKSGYLIVSYGDLCFNSIDKKEIKTQFSLGVVLNVMSNRELVRSYSQDAFVWKSVDADK